jgi:hypothetical protein
MSVERVESQDCPHLRQPRGRRLGPLGRAVAVPLQELPAHLQRAHQNVDGASAQEGALARSRPDDDRGPEPGQDRGTVRRSIRRPPSAGGIGFCAPADHKPRTLAWRKREIDCSPSRASRKANGNQSEQRMRSTSVFFRRVVCFSGAGDLVAKRGVSAASAAGQPIRSLPNYHALLGLVGRRADRHAQGRRLEEPRRRAFRSDH